MAQVDPGSTGGGLMAINGRSMFALSVSPSHGSKSLIHKDVSLIPRRRKAERHQSIYQWTTTFTLRILVGDNLRGRVLPIERDAYTGLAALHTGSNAHDPRRALTIAGLRFQTPHVRR